MTESKPIDFESKSDDVETNSANNPKGSDASLDGSSEPGKTKRTGTGAPGSHSALFGLIPDGQKKQEVRVAEEDLPQSG